ncbi:hypothetical protein A3A76_02120 [Candidatus Woesebacteria bacterium RIFCSPLOWO2_01_FULL_39_23]|uniref:Uncharacterized protein n=1 Tax=Candidatus Woesebacteria bacterium RIFCSPHIGHO2_01_FULL_40_22 TaxID=1802499 RepID=A0A1F7YI60_9BACT|nr:MAG: hypothetical protein A2141_03265 [Candidatus Woesebacteria bacterium RBG_16_40_11]OGM26195.1 MAG: hypothetical protein A2628_02550 [Candidatus Woesebacteria bacterium RIFCSPHIGHO2_01_FULL_40_22]OGM37982.1 MAG: hypothetical protein A3E41_03630 [Candidatus Woesebacteria bacterium RIFCSPHIGHO2_12_FULL_38_9]OGM62354.1 MAG: hypothetical protein A3A76_02120 [Candidatus Woesebacteria bacterium RIFCSPLOWO2_01_FULL_39_23]
MEPKPGRTPEDEALKQLQRDEMQYSVDKHPHVPRGRHNHSRYHKRGRQAILWTDKPDIYGVHRRGPSYEKWY